MTTVTSVIKSLLTLLEFALNSQYYKQPIPSEIDEKLGEIMSSLVSLEYEEMESIIEQVSGDNVRVLGLYAERIASLAVRNNNITLLKHGLFALLIYARTEDPKEILLVLSLLHDAAIKVTGTAQEIFNEVSSLIGEVDLVNNFLNRSDEDKSIDAMGYEESKNKEGFLYVRTW